MSNKKSLGHSPLGYDVIGNSNFDFIPDYNALIESENPDSFEKGPEAQTGMDSYGSKKSDIHPEDLKGKKIVSYYIEETITDRLREFANDHNSSFSAAASDAIKEFVESKGY